MAAVLLKGCFKPCEWCGQACVKCCKACGQCWSKCCECMQPCFDFIGNLFDMPFSFCIFFTLLTNVLPFIFAIYFLITDWDVGCDNPLREWLLVQTLLMLTHVILALYLIRKIAVEDMENMKGDSDFDKLCHFLMYDYGVACYILIAIFSFVWTFLGVGWISDEGNNTNVSNCKDTKFHNFTRAIQIIQLVFLFAGLFIIFLTMCHACDCLWDCVFASNRKDREARRDRRKRRIRERNERITRRKQERENRSFQANTPPSSAPMTTVASDNRQPAYNPHQYANTNQPSPQYDNNTNQPPSQGQSDSSTISKVAVGVANLAQGAAGALFKYADKQRQKRQNEQQHRQGEP